MIPTTMNNDEIAGIVRKTKEALEGHLIKHDHFDNARARVMSEIQFPTDTKLLFIVGPTGVGKTKLVESIAKDVMKYAAKERPSDEGCVPLVNFTVPYDSLTHRFDWRTFFQHYADQLAPALPVVDKKAGPAAVVLNAIAHRKPLVTLLDEANHFAGVASGKVLEEQMNRIKSFADRSRTLHICVGTYELANMAKLSGQLARRCEVIHFGRYRAATQSQWEYSQFKKVARTFNDSIPGAIDLALGQHAEYLYQRTVGCVGVLNTWIMRSLGNAVRNGRKVIKMEDLQATALPISRLQRMLDEAIRGEDQFNTSQEQFDDFLVDLGHKDPDSSPKKSDSELDLNLPRAPQKGNKPPPGEQSPRRHAAGGAFEKNLGGIAV